MKETGTPTPIVAKAEVDCSAVIKALVKKIAAPYKAATAARRKANAAGMYIGRVIVEACRDERIIGELKAWNSREEKRVGGGTATRAYNFVANKLAETMGYDADYLQQCARQYVNGFNKIAEQTRAKKLELNTKNGVLTIPDELKTLPDVKVEPPQSQKVTAPKMENIFPDPAAQKEEPEGEDLGEELAEKIVRAGNLLNALNPPVVNGLAKGLAHIFEAHGYAIVKRDAASKENQK